ncbi:testican-2-like [Montipora capricornis]|uniref:testican-2-like n=2 Tax=Montipora TaxID=46703 RepID=UPI0035F1C2C3
MLLRFLPIGLCMMYLHAVGAERSLATKKDPCYNVFCTKGRMCKVNSDLSTTCVCPVVCPDDYSPVCSVYLREFNNTCKLHKFACRVGILMGIERKEQCDFKDYEREPCPVSSLLQFHDRYLEYLRVAKDQSDPSYDPGFWDISRLTYEERKDIIEWEFNIQDKNSNDILDPDEIEAMLIPFEDCMIGFMKSCDYDHNPGISRVEWNTCFPPIVPELHEEEVEV